MTRNKEPQKLCSSCSIDNNESCNYHGKLHCDFKEKIHHKQNQLIG